MMNKIDELLEKYFEGETSLQEEATLRAYFQQTEIAEDHEQYRTMFNFFSDEREIQQLARSTKPVELAKPKARKRTMYLWAGVAASLLVALGGGLMFLTEEANVNKSIAYVNGKKISDVELINSHALNSLANVSEMDEDALDSQILLLDSFIN